MAMQKFKMYIVVGTGKFNHGDISLRDYEPSTDDSDIGWSKRIIGTTDIEVDVPEFDIGSLEIIGLEKAIQKERADSQVRVNILLDRLSKLKAIGHDVGDDQ